MKKPHKGFKRLAISQFKSTQLKYDTLGFALLECMMTVAIVGILSSIALPNYLNQVNRTRQNEVASTVAQIQTTIASYADEFGLLPESWADLNETAAIMTNSGPADKNNFSEITLPNEYYKISINNANNKFTITALRIDEQDLYVIGCLDLTNGASTIIKGPKEKEPEEPSNEPKAAMNDFCPHPLTANEPNVETT